MNEAAVMTKLQELFDTLKGFPRAAPGKGGDEGVYYSQLPGDARSLDETLDTLRLQIRYVMFDLEATRRENRYLRQMLENRHGRKDDEGQSGSGDL